jgi:hypothetical protein
MLGKTTIIFGAEPFTSHVQFKERDEIRKKNTTILFFDIQILSLVIAPLIPAIIV